MPLIYVTGISGSGKSAVREELRSRGFAALGVDEEGFGSWIDRRTGRPETLPRPGDDFDIHGWYRDHEWTLDAEKIARLKGRADGTNDLVFLCGVAANDAAVWKYFDVVVALVIDDETIRARIAHRDDAFGKQPTELDQILAWNADYESAYRRFGAVFVDASRPVSAVVDQILVAAGVESGR